MTWQTGCPAGGTAHRWFDRNGTRGLAEYDGTWRKHEVPVPPNASGRTRIVFDGADNAHLLMPYGRIVAASAASGWTDGTVLFGRPGTNVFGEVNLDLVGVLSVPYQQRSTGTTPSPVRAADFRLG